MTKKQGRDELIVLACDDEAINTYADLGFKKVEIKTRTRKSKDGEADDTGDDS